MFHIGSDSYYEILDIAPDCSQNDIRQAYVRAKAAYQKDSNVVYSLFDEHQTKAVLDAIEQAFLVLSNPDKRQEYDRSHGILGAYGQTKPRSLVESTGDRNSDASFEKSSDSPAPNSFSFATLKTASSAPSHSIMEELNSNKTASSQEAPPAETKTPYVRRQELGNSTALDPEFEAMVARETEFRGAFLQQLRERRGIALEELSDFTKISKLYLTAIEQENFKALPAAVYLRGFVTQIARALKLNPEQVIQGYMGNYRKVFGK